MSLIKTMQSKLVMTLLARDEEDIIENNITFHLAHGVDFIVATDNDSKDGTKKILKKYAKKGVLSFKIIKEHTYEQSKWVSEMAERAVSEFGATHLFHCDADEFWYPKSGNLKANLPSVNEVIYVPSSNYLPPRNLLVKLLNIRTVVTKGFNKEKYFEDDPVAKYLLYGYYPKIFTSSMFTKIAQGNHDVKDYRNFTRAKSKDIIIRHFPIRSYAQFEKKVINGGASYSKNPGKNTTVGWHWRAWYDLYLQGKLPEEYRKIVLSKKYRTYLINKGIVQLKFIPPDITFAKYLYVFTEIKQLMLKVARRVNSSTCKIKFFNFLLTSAVIQNIICE